MAKPSNEVINGIVFRTQYYANLASVCAVGVSLGNWYRERALSGHDSGELEHFIKRTHPAMVRHLVKINEAYQRIAEEEGIRFKPIKIKALTSLLGK